MKFEGKVVFLTFVFFLATSSMALAGMFGPLTSTSGPGKVSLGAGYSYISQYWKFDDISGKAPQTGQNQLFAQIEVGLPQGWRAYARGGVADWKVKNTFRFSDTVSDGGFLPFGTAGFSGPLFRQGQVEIGPFFQGSYFSLYDDNTSITVSSGTGIEKVYFDNAWEINAGVAFQMKMDGAYLYGGPFYFQGNSKYRSVAQAGGVTDVNESDMKEKTNFGGFLGIRWPLGSGLSLEIEGQYKSDATVGALVDYTF